MSVRLTKFRNIFNSVKLPERLKGGRIEKWADYWVNVATDYKLALESIGEGIRDRPLKSSVYISLIGVGIYAIKTNPTETQLRHRLTEQLNKSALMSGKVRNRRVDAKYNHFVQCFNNDSFRRLNLILFSLAWEDNYHSDCAVVKATVSHLKPKYTTFLQERVLDVGCFGRWWYLENISQEMDINEDEWDEEGRQKPEYRPKESGPVLSLML